MTDQYRNTHVLRIDGKGCHGEIVLHSLDAAHQIAKWVTAWNGDVRLWLDNLPVSIAADWSLVISGEEH